MARILLLDTEAWRRSVLLRRLWPTVRDVHHISDPQLIAGATDSFEVAVIVIRDPLQLYLQAIGYLKALSGKVQVLAIFAGGNLPAEYSLLAARVRGADAVLYHPHSEDELANAVLTLLGNQSIP